jgi:tetratricopeptide (TPR) repeat protein
MRKWLLNILLMLAFVNVHADESVDLVAIYNAANESYVAKDYAAAIEGYEQLLSIGKISPAVYYNLGNAYFRSGNMGMSILNYERALKMDPEHADAAFNLRLANLRINDRIEPTSQFILITWYQRLIHGRSASGWGIWALCAIWLALAIGVVYIFSGKLMLRRLSFASMTLLVVVSVLLLIFARVQYQYENNTIAGIITVTNTYVKAAPDQTSTDLFILREGTKVTLLDTQDGWQKVSVGDNDGDKVGWVREDVLGLI